MKSPVYDLVVGNIPGTRKADDPIKDWQPQVESDVDQTASAVMTRAAVKRDSKPLKPLHVTQSDVSSVRCQILRKCKPRTNLWIKFGSFKIRGNAVKMCIGFHMKVVYYTDIFSHLL